MLVVDNYDSFAYNLVQYLGELGAEPVVVRNDDLGVDEIVTWDIDAVVISPGPGRPEDAGITCDLVRASAGRWPLLGVCLGHQAIGAVHGAEVVRAGSVMHGKASVVRHDGSGVFTGLPDPLTVARYHSLVVDPATVPDELVVTARTDDGVVMGLRHRSHQIHGVQFHPESILSEAGHQLLRRFLDLSEAPAPAP